MVCSFGRPGQTSTDNSQKEDLDDPEFKLLLSLRSGQPFAVYRIEETKIAEDNGAMVPSDRPLLSHQQTQADAETCNSQSESTVRDLRGGFASRPGCGHECPVTVVPSVELYLLVVDQTSFLAGMIKPLLPVTKRGTTAHRPPRAKTSCTTL